MCTDLEQLHRLLHWVSNGGPKSAVT
jgi:hypothetical protein